MKVLFLNARKSDYLQDGIYTGLVKKLGAKNVVEWPLNLRLHLNTKQYPKNTGYAKGTLLPRLFASIKTFDLVIVASSAPACIEDYIKFRPSIPSHVPIVFLDGGDREEIGGDLLRAGRRDLYEELQKNRPFDFIFKREMLLNKDYAANILPLPFCFNLDALPTKVKNNTLRNTMVKRYDVSFWAVESHPIRSQALDILENHFDCKKNGTERNQTFKKYPRRGSFYLEEIQACKIVLNFRGGGWDTLRYWEVPATATLMLSQKPGIQIPYNFEDGKNVVFIKDDLSDLIDKCQYYLANVTERENIARAGFEHLKNHHLDIHRADFVLRSALGV